MNKWIVNQEKNISALWIGSNPDLVAEYKLETSDPWENIGELTSLGDNMFTIPFTFTTIGDYMVRIRDVNTNVSIFDKLSVLELVDIEQSISNINSKIDNKGFV